MQLNTYQLLASRTQPAPGAQHFFAPPLGALSGIEVEAGLSRELFNRNVDLVHAVLGLFSEGGELAGTVKSMFAYGKFSDPEAYTKEARANMIIEAGDKLWYIALLCRALGVTLEEVAAANIVKLRARYPDGYTDIDAVTRADTARPEVDYCPELDAELDAGDRLGRALCLHVQNMGAANIKQVFKLEGGTCYRLEITRLAPGEIPAPL